MSAYNVPLEQVLYSNYIKYDRMSQMVESTFMGSTATSVNIYIDIYSMIRNVYNNENLTKENYLIISSSLINLCAHMRYFFRNRYNVESIIYLVYSSNTPEYNKKLWFGYNDAHEKIMSNMNVRILIEYNLNVLETLVPYLPDIHFVRGEFEAGVLMYKIMTDGRFHQKDDIIPNIILSTDPYLFQLVTQVPNTVVFRPKKQRSEGRTEDVSFVIARGTLLNFLFKIRKVEAPEYLSGLNDELYTLILALSRCPERSIISFFNLPTAIELISSGIFKYKILNGYNISTEIVWNALYNSKFEKYSYDLFDRRFKAIDIFSQIYAYNSTNPAPFKFTNLIDPDNVRQINDTYFKQYPLNLNDL